MRKDTVERESLRTTPTNDKKVDKIEQVSGKWRHDLNQERSIWNIAFGCKNTNFEKTEIIHNI